MRHKPLALALCLFTLALALPACAGAATREASAQVEHVQGQLQATLDDLAAAQATGDMESIEGLQDQVVALSAALKDAVGALPAAWKADIDAAKGQGQELLGTLTTGGAQGGVIGLGLMALSWWARDRRKKQGNDPLQRKDIATPPVSDGPA